MYQSSPRKNFLDILADPTAIAILGSIALHATIGATLPFFTQPEKAGTKAGPTTVKVVELTPNELQRIPQAPPTPVPTPPVAQPTPMPTTPTAKAPAPSTPEFSTSPQTIPFPSVLGTPKPKPKAGSKPQTAIPPNQTAAPIFDPSQIFQPTPKPRKSPLPKGTPKPSVQPQPVTKSQPLAKKTQPLKTPAPQQTPTDDDGGEQQQPTTPATKTPSQAQKPAITPQPAGTPTSSLPNSTTPTTPAQSQGNDNKDYVAMQQAAAAKEIEYRTKYPGIVVHKIEELRPPFPAGMVCPKTKQIPIVVYMVAFDKVPENQQNNVLGSITPDSIDAAAFASGDTPENRKLIAIAKDTAISAANTADQNRPAADKGKQVLYQYKVQFACKQ